MRISGVVITFNEQYNILRCIHSLQQVADEIIVVDSFSTDNTSHLCKEEGCVFVEHPFEGYGQQKNYGNSLAKYDYILSLDADEILSSELATYINKEKQNPQADVYSCNRTNFVAGKWTRYGGFYPDKKIRLWKKDTVQWSTRIVHEEPLVKAGHTIKHMPFDILHYAYNTYADFKNTYWHYNQLKAQTYRAKGKHMNYLHYIGRRSFKFFRSFIIKRGFLDGSHGYKIACIFATVEEALYKELKK